jgi:hypothetical protein
MPQVSGRVYDLDFIAASDWCQALIRDGQSDVAVVTSDHRAQTILETAMALNQNVEVTYEDDDPKRIVRVKLNLG